jgi:site-specific DNA recombinase
MTMKAIRCAIYTRVSTEQGLEQDFNSLDAQYDASQGGNTDRPALQRLLQDVRAGKIDVIVVYKVDRLSRSLADFAKLVELFDRHNVSFVSVTQQFNTTTSMGRLTLNVLLSFAQFERELTSERIRDKISASKRKGLWVGGMAPLGYDTKGRKITVNEAEAERVRSIFRSYLKLGSLNRLMAELREQGILTKVRTLRTGETVGGIRFTRGSLAHLLRNRFYIGEVSFKGEILQGEQPAILGRDLFDAVQAKLNEQVNSHKAIRTRSEALLAGRIFDDGSNRMSPSHARKGSIKYRYYLSSVLLQGAAARAGSVRRVSAAEVEAVVIRSVREHLKLSEPIDDPSLINQHVARVEVQPEQLVIELAGPHGLDTQGAEARQPRRDGGTVSQRSQMHLCDRLNNLLEEQQLVYKSLTPWYPSYSLALPYQLGVVSGYVLPVLLGLLGSMTYVLRRYLRCIGDRLLTPLDLREYILRVVLGAVFGVTIGFFTNAIPSQLGALGAPGLAFLAGYGVEVVFRMLDGLAAQFSPARK